MALHGVPDHALSSMPDIFMDRPGPPSGRLAVRAVCLP
jgi:hypothetical protein